MLKSRTLCFIDILIMLKQDWPPLKLKIYLDPEVTIIVQGISASSSENIMNVADKLITEGFRCYHC